MLGVVFCTPVHSENLHSSVSVTAFAWERMLWNSCNGKTFSYRKRQL